jgi:hypothetical protein
LTWSGDAGELTSECSVDFNSKGIVRIHVYDQRCHFTSVEAFRAFCDVGDVDPDDGRRWERREFRGCRRPPYLWIWMSRKKDVVFETSANPLEDGYCRDFGLTGVADKAIAMYNFMHDNYGEDELTIWAQMTWSREYC